MTDLKQFAQVQAEVSFLVAPIMQLNVADRESAIEATAAAKQVKILAKKIEERRKEIVAPLNEEVKSINSLAKQIAEPLLKAEEFIKSQLVAFEREEMKKREEAMRLAEIERKRREEEIRLQAQKEKEDAEFLAAFDPMQAQRAIINAEASASIAVVESLKAHKAEVKNIEASKVAQTRKHWTFDLIDLDKVPREFLVLDEKKVRAAILEGRTEIEGLKIYQELKVAIR